jgi:LysR family glycine cleavage system transcriptional activator
MQSLGSKLPPLRSLVAFEAAARHLSFTNAATELTISREAVSRQIRMLEEHLGIKLFDRLHRQIALTTSGKKFQSVIQESLENVAHVTGTIRRPGRPFRISVGSTIAITSFWLTPRLSRFRSKHPNVEIHVAISDAPQDLLANGIDVGLRYGDGSWTGLEALRLFGVECFPVCSPEYLEGTAPINEPADLLQHNLVNLDGVVHASEDWWWWLKGQGVEVPKSLKTLGFDSYDNVIQVALEGQGVAMGFSGYVTGLLETGRLVRPMEAKLTSRLAVYLVVPGGVKPAPKVQDFINWVLKEAATKGNQDGHIKTGVV